ncbi:MAG: TIGR04086 family membrane protein, partial [Lachnospiraceae bacterium]
MEKNQVSRMRAQILPTSLFSVLVGLLAGYLVTLMGLFILALLLLQFQLSSETIEIGILVLYLLSVFIAGFLVGKVKKTKKFLWGMAEGMAYYLVLLLLSVLVQKSLGADGRELFTAFCLC